MVDSAVPYCTAKRYGTHSELTYYKVKRNGTQYAVIFCMAKGLGPTVQYFTVKRNARAHKEEYLTHSET
jgi:hypothetical protein